MRSLRFVSMLILLGLLGLSLVQLGRINRGVTIEQTSVEQIPVTVFRPANGQPRHVAVLAHGFAGSQQMLYPLATTLAQHGWIAVTFDFNGHGRNPTPFTFSFAGNREQRDTSVLEANLDAVVDYVQQTTGIDDVAIAGHSMGSAVVVNYAKNHPDIIATIGLSLISDQTTAELPRNLLILTGALEFANIKTASQNALTNATSPQAVADTTYGDAMQGTGRRLEFVPNVEHISILYTNAMYSSATRWLQASVGEPTTINYTDQRMLWVGLAYVSGLGLLLVLLTWLPRLEAWQTGTRGGWRSWVVAFMPALITPLVLAIMPVSWVPILVGGYVVQFFAVYGMVQLLAAWLFKRWHSPFQHFHIAQLGLAMMIALYVLMLVGGVAHVSYLNFVPTSGRFGWIALFMLLMLVYFAADACVERGAWATLGARVLFVVALLAGVVLRPDAGFVLLVLPLFIIFFALMGLIAWALRRRVAPLIIAISSAIVFGWMLGIALPFTG